MKSINELAQLLKNSSITGIIQLGVIYEDIHKSTKTVDSFLLSLQECKVIPEIKLYIPINMEKNNYKSGVEYAMSLKNSGIASTVQFDAEYEEYFYNIKPLNDLAISLKESGITPEFKLSLDIDFQTDYDQFENITKTVDSLSENSNIFTTYKKLKIMNLNAIQIPEIIKSANKYGINELSLTDSLHIFTMTDNNEKIEALKDVNKLLETLSAKSKKILTSLTFSKNALGTEGINTLMGLVDRDHFPKLKELHLGQNLSRGNITTTDNALLAKFLRELPDGLEILHLNDNNLGIGHELYKICMLRRINPEDKKALADLIAIDPKFQIYRESYNIEAKHSIDGNNIFPCDLTDIVTSLEKFSLTRLRLDYNQLTDETGSFFLNSIDKSKLKKFEFQGNDLGNFESLAKTLAECSELQTINLNNCRISNEGQASLNAFIQNFEAVEVKDYGLITYSV